MSELSDTYILKNDKSLKFIKKSFSNEFIGQLISENPMYALKYIKAIKKLHKKTKLIDIDYMQQISINTLQQITQNENHLNTYFETIDKCIFCDKRVGCKIHNKDRAYDTPYYYYIEFISIINEISEYLPHQYKPNIIKPFIINGKNRDLERVFYENPLFTIEYLKLIIYFEIDLEYQLKNIEQPLLEALERDRANNDTIFIELIRMFNRENKILRYRCLEDISQKIIWFIKDRKENIRKNSEMTLECINFLSIYDKTEIILDIFPEFKQISEGRKTQEFLTDFQIFFNLFKK